MHTHVKMIIFALLVALPTGCQAQTSHLPPTLALLPAITSTPAPTTVPPTATATQALPTDTPTPQPSPTETPIPTATPTPEPLHQGRVAEGRGGLRFRAKPDTESWVLGNLPEGSMVTIIGRTGDNYWLEIKVGEGVTGWVWASYITRDQDLSLIPITSDVLQPTAVLLAPTMTPGPGNPPPNPVSTRMPPAPPPSNVVSGITAHSREIFLRGHQRGNRAAVFSKVGDSLTVATYVLYPFGWRTYDLADYAYYYPVIEYYSTVLARDTADSFGNISLAADNGWTTANILDPGSADPTHCQPGESPLVCEYRTVRPSVALILIGTNDVALLPADTYRNNLARIVEISIDMGVIPILCTIPWRTGYEANVQQFNQIIVETARGFDVPLLDYFSAMENLPNSGLSSDGVHPSWPPGEYSDAARFTAENLSYGYTVRNFTAIQVLDAIWRRALR